MHAQKSKPTNYALSRNSGADKAEKLSAAIAQVFQGHKAKLGSKTLMAIAWSARSN